METTKEYKKRTQGMNWISQHKRLAIYLRDGLACAYCGTGIESGERLTLDHLTPYSHGGSNEATNLVTCCNKCNSSRGNRSVIEFANGIASYLGTDANTILTHVAECARRPLDIATAKQMVTLRGSCAKAINNE